MFLLDFLFPKKCAGCGKLGIYLCESCKNLQPLHLSKICPLCERPAVEGRIHPGCRTPLSLDGATFIFKYQPPVANLIKHLKYRFARDLLKIIVLWSVTELKNIDLPAKNFTLIPVPLHTYRHNWRGFNQAEALGKEIARAMGWQFSNDILVRSRWRPPQTEVKKEQARRQNTRGIFSVNQSLITNHQSLILFDDVWTTGATIKEAAKVLKRKGAKFAWGLTIAR